MGRTVPKILGQRAPHGREAGVAVRGTRRQLLFDRPCRREECCVGQPARLHLPQADPRKGERVVPLAADVTYPCHSTGAKGRPVATSAVPLVQAMSSSGVASARSVGFGEWQDHRPPLPPPWPRHTATGRGGGPVRVSLVEATRRAGIGGPDGCVPPGSPARGPAPLRRRRTLRPPPPNRRS